MEEKKDGKIDFEIVLNPEDCVYQQFVALYAIVEWGFFEDTYRKMLAVFGPAKFRYYTALEKGTKTPLSSLLVVEYDSIDGSIDLVCVGKYFTNPPFYGHGLGETVWKRALSCPEYQDRNWGLIGVPAMHKKYAQKYGFDKYYESDLLVVLRKFKDLDVSRLETEEGVRIVEFDEADYRKVLAYDVVVSGNQRRDAFLKTWMHSEGMLAAKVALNTHGDVVGYVAVCDHVHMVTLCPLFAVNAGVASTLLKHALEQVISTGRVPADDLFRTIGFESNTQAEQLFDKLTPVKRQVAKVYGQFTKFVPKVAYDQVYCLTELCFNVI